ncbi:hypothetical protein RSSM_04937 [Rhodopirellula sallentina SM41]|uniref:Uncharacterized protein n=1 Tax=Rhodopirellula sallentina SM41 TaxID=1263870 RepID=M5TWL0_9BACT|nr:hypothetical protein RSSM_04937 [Rhodopirellula sallentina SM41]
MNSLPRYCISPIDSELYPVDIQRVHHPSDAVRSPIHSSSVVG